MNTKKIKNQVDTKAGIAIRGAIGIDQINPLGFVADLEVDCAKGNYFKIDLEGDIRFEMVNMLPGSYLFIIKQDAVGGHSITYSSKFKFVNEGDGALSAVAGAIDLLNCVFDGEYIYSSVLLNFR